VQETCLALKPILGEQAAQLWQAYLLQDEDGKHEIEEQVELLANVHLHTDVDDKTPAFAPPTAELAGGDFQLGDVWYNQSRLHPFGLRRSELFQHTAIFGRSGAGKTNLGFLFVNTLVSQGIPVLILDWKRNFRDLLALPGFEKLEVYTIGRDISPFRFNPLIPPADVPPKSWLKKIIEVMANAFFLGDGSMYLLQHTIDAVYRENGVYSGAVEDWPTFRDVLKKLKSIPAKGREMLWLSSALRAVSVLCFGQSDQIFNVSRNSGLEQVFSKQVVFEMESLAQSDKVFFAQSILLWLHMFKLASRGFREELSNVVVIEEAHHILSKRARQNSAAGESITDTVFRELREFGVGLCLMDQHPSEISLTALGNTYTTACMNLKSATDVNVMAGAMLLDSDEKKVLGNMPVGKAVVKLQGRVPESFIIHVPLMQGIRKGVVTDETIQKRMKHAVLMESASVDEDAGVGGEAEESSESSGADSVTGLSADAKRFLKDIEEYPDSGVAARYRRLGLSGRVGDRLKKELIAKGLIEETDLRTDKGRVKVLRQNARIRKQMLQ